MSDAVQITLDREDWARIVRLAESSAEVSTQSAEDAEDWDPDEGPDFEWIEGRRRGAVAAREFAARVRQQVEEGLSDGRSDV
ncbi:hypothetical protein [Curtobacterium flaccumfaciens]|uniref:hypothetical protein n=1 Tax=Curtobacterium flaccumfaciens TaxID=2035 RepID=UPI00188A8DAB|nr:hypothetical protein [Curtobacterium flaccumfaciens]MBF4629562.1 hypothetical protein [Curtobacterium flaccumfaciens]